MLHWDGVRRASGEEEEEEEEEGEEAQGLSADGLECGPYVTGI